MNSTSSSKWLIRLLILCVLSVALLFSLQEQEANALVFSCGEDLNHCTFNCALAHQNDVQAYHACRMGCLDVTMLAASAHSIVNHQTVQVVMTFLNLTL